MVSCGPAWAIASKAVLDGAPATVVYDVGDAEFTVLERDRGPGHDDAPVCLDCLLDMQPGLAAASTSRTNTEQRCASMVTGNR